VVHCLLVTSRFDALLGHLFFSTHDLQYPLFGQVKKIFSTLPEVSFLFGLSVTSNDLPRFSQTRETSSPSVPPDSAGEKSVCVHQSPPRSFPNSIYLSSAPSFFTFVVRRGSQPVFFSFDPLPKNLKVNRQGTFWFVLPLPQREPPPPFPLSYSAKFVILKPNSFIYPVSLSLSSFFLCFFFLPNHLPAALLTYYFTKPNFGVPPESYQSFSPPPRSRSLYFLFSNLPTAPGSCPF